MKHSFIESSIRSLLLFAVMGVACLAPAASQEPQTSVREAYFRAVADYFGVDLREVTIIGDWDLDPDEVPVVLFMARRAGVSPDVLIGSRRGSRSWMEVGTRFGLDGRVFHLALPPDRDLGPLTEAMEKFRSRPPVQWGRIRLEDPEIVAFVNVRVLSDQAGVPPLRVLETWTEAGSFMAAYPRLRNR